MVSIPTFQIILYYKGGIMCIYAQNYTIGCAKLWQTLTYVALPKAKWIVGGDFNNEEPIEDRNQGNFGNAVGRREFNAWNAFVASLRLMDIWNLDEFRKIRHRVNAWYGGSV
jgi:hypothetical protein